MLGMDATIPPWRLLRSYLLLGGWLWPQGTGKKVEKLVQRVIRLRNDSVKTYDLFTEQKEAYALSDSKGSELTHAITP